jgi:hypothetical protein
MEMKHYNNSLVEAQEARERGEAMFGMHTIFDTEDPHMLSVVEYVDEDGTPHFECVEDWSMEIEEGIDDELDLGDSPTVILSKSALDDYNAMISDLRQALLGGMGEFLEVLKVYAEQSELCAKVFSELDHPEAIAAFEAKLTRYA